MEYVFSLEMRVNKKLLFPPLRWPVGLQIRPPTEKKERNVLETVLGGKRPLKASPADALHLADHGVSEAYFPSAKPTLFTYSRLLK